MPKSKQTQQNSLSLLQMIRPRMLAFIIPTLCSFSLAEHSYLAIISDQQTTHGRNTLAIALY